MLAVLLRFSVCLALIGSADANPFIFWVCRGLMKSHFAKRCIFPVLLGLSCYVLLWEGPRIQIVFSVLLGLSRFHKVCRYKSLHIITFCLFFLDKVLSRGFFANGVTTWSVCVALSLGTRIFCLDGRAPSFSGRNHFLNPCSCGIEQIKQPSILSLVATHCCQGTA